MIDFNNILNKDNLLNKVSNYQILKFYLPQLEVGGVVSSPLRSDSNPSFSMFNSRYGVLVRDFSTNKIYNGITFVMELMAVNFFMALSIINRDLGLGMIDDNASALVGHKLTKSEVVIDDPKEHSSKVITYSFRDWNQDDADYWRPFGITSKQLIESKTFPIKYFWINNQFTIMADKLAYVYMFYEHKGIFRVKIYQPYNKTWKWTTNLDSTVVDGIKELEPSDLLIITKSRKDRLVLNNFGYQAIAVNNEGSFIPDSLFEKLTARYPRILLFFDNDKAGKEMSTKFSELYDIENIAIPDEYEEKDVADFVKSYGNFVTKDVLTKLINK